MRKIGSGKANIKNTTLCSYVLQRNRNVGIPYTTTQTNQRTRSGNSRGSRKTHAWGGGSAGGVAGRGPAPGSAAPIRAGRPALRLVELCCVVLCRIVDGQRRAIDRGALGVNVNVNVSVQCLLGVSEIGKGAGTVSPCCGAKCDVRSSQTTGSLAGSTCHACLPSLSCL